jgi:hypothetical protein
VLQECDLPFTSQTHFIMMIEPRELLTEALRNDAVQSQYLAQKITQVQIQNTPKANRRNLAADGSWAERRRAERRKPQRACAGRRENSDRRLSYDERMDGYHRELAQVLKRSIELSRLKRLLSA